jgi:hypothetical protein
MISVLSLLLAATAPATLPQAPVNSAADLALLHEVAKCVVASNPKRTGRLIALDWWTAAYQQELRARAKENGRCLDTGRLQFGGVVLAGAMAEQLVERLPTSLSASAQIVDPPIAARSATEVMALCTVRQAPEQVSALMITKPGTPNEMAAIRALSPTLGNCLAAGATATLNAAGTRAVLALAAWRIADPLRGKKSR